MNSQNGNGVSGGTFGEVALGSGFQGAFYGTFNATPNGTSSLFILSDLAAQINMHLRSSHFQ